MIQMLQQLSLQKKADEFFVAFLIIIYVHIDHISVIILSLSKKKNEKLFYSLNQLSYSGYLDWDTNQHTKHLYT